MNNEILAIIKSIPPLYAIWKIFLENLKSSQKREEINLSDVLTGGQVYLLLSIRSNDARPAWFYGKDLMKFNEVKSNENHDGWSKAAQYACTYLFALGLIEVRGGMAGEVLISELGNKILNSKSAISDFSRVYAKFNSS